MADLTLNQLLMKIGVILLEAKQDWEKVNKISKPNYTLSLPPEASLYWKPDDFDHWETITLPRIKETGRFVRMQAIWHQEYSDNHNAYDYPPGAENDQLRVSSHFPKILEKI